MGGAINSNSIQDTTGIKCAVMTSVSTFR